MHLNRWRPPREGTEVYDEGCDPVAEKEQIPERETCMCSTDCITQAPVSHQRLDQGTLGSNEPGVAALVRA